MGAIGEYVHYRQERYQEFGLGRTEPRGKKFAIAYKDAKKDLRAFITQTETSIDLVELEKNMNMIKKRVGKNATKAIPKFGWGTDSLDQFFIEQVQKHFESKKRIIDFEKLDIHGLLEKEYMKYQKRQNSQDSYFQLQTFNKFKMKLESSISTIQTAMAQGTISPNEAKAVLANLSLIQAESIQLTNDIQMNSAKRLPFSTTADLFDRYNQIIQGYALPAKKELGDLGEMFAMYAALRAAQKSEEEIKKLFLEFLKNPTSAHRSQTAYDLSGIIDEKDLGKGFYNFSMNTSKYRRNLFVTVAGSQDTIDIITSFPDDDLRASVKNVRSLGASIQVLSGAPVTALFNLVNTDFVNHYMNMLAFQKSGIFSKQLKHSAEVLSEATLVRALSGARQRQTLNSSLANTLIINQRQGKGSIKIFSVSSLLKDILKGKKIINDSLKITLSSDAKDFSQIKIDNTEVGNFKTNPNFSDAGKRIANIFSQIHNVKMQASLLPNALKKF